MENTRSSIICVLTIGSVAATIMTRIFLGNANLFDMTESTTLMEAVRAGKSNLIADVLKTQNAYIILEAVIVGLACGVCFAYSTKFNLWTRANMKKYSLQTRMLLIALTASAFGAIAFSTTRQVPTFLTTHPTFNKTNFCYHD